MSRRAPRPYRDRLRPVAPAHAHRPRTASSTSLTRPVQVPLADRTVARPPARTPPARRVEPGPAGRREPMAPFVSPCPFPLSPSNPTRSRRCRPAELGPHPGAPAGDLLDHPQRHPGRRDRVRCDAQGGRPVRAAGRGRPGAHDAAPVPGIGEISDSGTPDERIVHQPFPHVGGVVGQQQPAHRRRAQRRERPPTGAVRPVMDPEPAIRLQNGDLGGTRGTGRDRDPDDDRRPRAQDGARPGHGLPGGAGAQNSRTGKPTSTSTPVAQHHRKGVTAEHGATTSATNRARRNPRTAHRRFEQIRSGRPPRRPSRPCPVRRTDPCIASHGARSGCQNGEVRLRVIEHCCLRWMGA